MSIVTSHKLKSLETQKSNLIAEISSLKLQVATAQKEQNKKSKALEEIEEKIKALSGREPVVTEHAILRYLEHSGLVSLDQIRKKILTEKTVEIIKLLKNGQIPLEGKLFALIKDSTVITIVNKKKEKK